MPCAKWISSAAVVGLVAALPVQADVKISDKPTQNMSCSGGVCSPTAKDAILNATDLANMLAGGDVTVNTGGTLAKDIDISAALSWASTSRLTLDAYRSVTVNKPVSVTGTGAVTITLNDGGTGGDLLFVNKGSLTFWDVGSSLIVNGNSYTLVADIKTLSSDIAANPSGLYALAKDYDASIDGTYTDSPVATTLQGTFEGLGHTISNLTISTQNVLNTGFFAQIGSAGIVRDTQLRSVRLSSTTNLSAFSSVGALAGENDGVIRNAAVNGSVTATLQFGGAVGGLAGLDTGIISGAHSNGHVESTIASEASVGGLLGKLDGSMDGASAQVLNSFATVSTRASADSAAGGLIGESNDGLVERSHAAGDVYGGDQTFAGGLVGSNGGSIDQSYATGSIQSGNSETRHCFSGSGGLVGGNGGSISNSYAMGSAEGGQQACVGGLIGSGIGSSATSYSTGSVSGQINTQVGGFVGHFYKKNATAVACDWDTDTSGTLDASGNRSHLPGVDGLTTQQFLSGLPQGFDPKVWAIDPKINDGFPYLIANPPP